MYSLSLGLSTSAILGFALSLWVVRVITYHSRRRGLPHPPGPKGYPLVGNLLQFPLKHPWLVFEEWAKVYGDMIYMENLGQPVLVLNSLERAQDLLEKRSATYSDRPAFVMLMEVMGWDFNFAFLDYGIAWRRQRRSFHENFNTIEIRNYDNVLKAETNGFLHRLQTTPEDFSKHIRHVLAAITVKIAYGLTIAEENDPYVCIAEECLEGVSEAGAPGRFLVEFIPFMKYIPTWFPGSTWKRWGEHHYHLNQIVVNMPFECVKENLKKGTALPSVAASLIEKLPEPEALNWQQEETLARNVAATVYSSAIDSTVSTFSTFILAMCLHPEIQKKAQAELDNVLGGRLVDFADRDSLPYINAIIKECLRWRPVVPLIPRKSTKDDVYNGYFIQRGTIILASVWSMLHDPKVFPEPSRFLPERFLHNGQLNPDTRDPALAFGLGRRVCAGRHFAERVLFILVASVLATFDMALPLNEDGNTEMQAKFSSGLLSYPEPFEAKFVPRSKQAVTSPYELMGKKSNTVYERFHLGDIISIGSDASEV